VETASPDRVANMRAFAKAALDLLSGKGRIVLLATHDPLLALSSPRRAALGNGGIRAVLPRTEEEERVLRELSSLDARVEVLRKAMRAGEALA